TAVPWYRLLYVYSAGLTDRLVELIAREPRIVPYLDIPIQHASDRMLERMRRPERRQTLRAKLAWLRDTIPDLAVRTTCLVGFPGETDENFRQLLEFLEEAQFDRLGAFAYSPQEGTLAAAYPDDVPEGVQRGRSEELFARAQQVLPGGVNSPVRAFRAVGGTPFFVAGAAGARLTDVDGKTYVDYVCSWGPLILGHGHPAVLEAIRAAAAQGWTY